MSSGIYLIDMNILVIDTNEAFESFLEYNNLYGNDAGELEAENYGEEISMKFESGSSEPEIALCLEGWIEFESEGQISRDYFKDGEKKTVFATIVWDDPFVEKEEKIEEVPKKETEIKKVGNGFEVLYKGGLYSRAHNYPRAVKLEEKARRFQGKHYATHKQGVSYGVAICRTKGFKDTTIKDSEVTCPRCLSKISKEKNKGGK